MTTINNQGRAYEQFSCCQCGSILCCNEILDRPTLCKCDVCHFANILPRHLSRADLVLTVAGTILFGVLLGFWVTILVGSAYGWLKI